LCQLLKHTLERVCTTLVIITHNTDLVHKLKHLISGTKRNQTRSCE